MRRLVVGLVVVALAGFALSRVSTSLLVWEVAVVALFVAAVWRRRPAPPAGVAPLVLADPGLPGSRLSVLSRLELELADAIDPLLAGAPRVQARLLHLAAGRTGAGDEAGAAAVLARLGEPHREVLTRSGPLTLTELDAVVTRIERL